MRPAGWLMLALPLIGCGMPDTPAAIDAARDGVSRRSYAVPGADLRVSMLVKGDPEGRRVIFVHGTPGSADGWERYLAQAPAGIEMIAVDRPGFGATQPGSAVLSLQSQAAAIAPLLVERNGLWPILVGHSLGAPIVAQVALDFPNRVGALLILAGAFDPALEQVYGIQHVGEWPGVRSLLPRAMRNANLELMALKPELEMLAPRLAGLHFRVAIVHGTKDRNVPFANVAFLRARIPARCVNVVALAGRNHFIPWTEQPVIERVLDRLIAVADRPC